MIERALRASRRTGWLTLSAAQLVLILGLVGSSGGWAADAVDGGESGAQGAKASRPIRIVGSGYTMPVFMRPWAKAFETRTGVPVVVEPSGTSTGPPALAAGRAEIAAMTRPLHEAEAGVLEAALGAMPLVLPVAEDALVVFVNADNPLEQLTIAQVDAIYSRTRLCGAPEPITQWGQVGVAGDYKSRSIALFGRRAASGTGALFRARALCGGSFKNWMRVSPGRESASLMVAESRFGIGFGSLRDRRPGMKSLAIAASAGSPFVAPNDRSPGRAPYPLTRTLDFVVAIPAEGPVDPKLLDFLEYVYSPEAQRRVVEQGYSPLIGDLLRSGLEKIRALRVRAAASSDPAAHAADRAR